MACCSPWDHKELDTTERLNGTELNALYGASLVAQMVKNPPAMQETWVRSLGWEDPLEKGKATLSSILAWRIPWTAKSYMTELLCCPLDSPGKNTGSGS